MFAARCFVFDCLYQRCICFGKYNRERKCKRGTSWRNGFLLSGFGTGRWFSDYCNRGGNVCFFGTLENGILIVDAENAKVQLVLDGAEITNSESAAIYVREEDEVFITTADDSQNSLMNKGAYTQLDENNIDAVIFSKSDLTLNGSGNLEITAGEGHGVVSKDDLVLAGGSYEITADSHGLSRKFR